MIKEAIEKILELAKPAIIETDGREYSTVNLLPIKKPAPEFLAMHTLQGIIDWIKSDDYKESLIHIGSYQDVHVLSNLFGDWEQRKHYIQCTPFRIQSFPFDEYMPIEDFIIRLRCNFVQTDEQQAVIDFLSKIRGEAVTTAEDDGIAQEVTMEDKIGRLSQVKLEPVVKLHPFRTFPEITQPGSPFLLRMRTQGSQLPVVTLHEIDGGIWKVKAVETIKRFFSKNSSVAKRKINILS